MSPAEAGPSYTIVLFFPSNHWTTWNMSVRSVRLVGSWAPKICASSALFAAICSMQSTTEETLVSGRVHRILRRRTCRSIDGPRPASARR